MEHDLHKMMMEMNKKIDAMMAHLGCSEKVSEKDFLGMSDEDKDKYQEESIRPEDNA